MSVQSAEDARGLTRTISQFQPAASVGLSACEEHYTAVHTKFARHLLRSKSHVVSYHIGRATAAYGLNGDWLARPEAYRYIFLQFHAGRSLEFTPREGELLAEDHRRFLRDLRGFSVDTTPLVDRMSGQTALTTYVFEVDRRAEQDAGQARADLLRAAAQLSEAADDAFGLRRLTVSPVAAEFRSEPIDEPGQRPTRERLPSTERVGFLEVHFDQREWAEDWMASEPVREVLTDPGWGRLTGHRVHLECGLDRT